MTAWIFLSLLSALFLGLYDIAKKDAVKGNAVPPVLLLNVLTAAAIWTVPIVGSWAGLFPVDSEFNQITSLNPAQHLMLMLKSMMVGASWICAFFALKSLPISIATPIRATSPVWTILVAVSFMGERPGLFQWLGILIVLLAFFGLSRVGAQEGIHFHRNRAVALMIVATVLGSLCALYDKVLLQQTDLRPAAVQAWFSIYLVPVMLPLAIRWWRRDRGSAPFHWRWSIPLIAMFLLVADFSYFTALSDPNSLISVVSPLRRGSVVIAFLFGVLNLKEENWRAKAPCVAAILTGVILLSQ